MNAEDTEQACRLPSTDFISSGREACLAACCGTIPHLCASVSKALSDTTPSPPKTGSPLSDTSKYRFLRTTDSNSYFQRYGAPIDAADFKWSKKTPIISKGHALILPNIQALVKVTAYEFQSVVPNDQQENSEQVL